MPASWRHSPPMTNMREVTLLEMCLHYCWLPPCCGSYRQRNNGGQARHSNSAAWTLLILFATVGIYRWSRILTGRTAIATWRADEQQGSEWYRRAMRAHINCLENLPI